MARARLSSTLRRGRSSFPDCYLLTLGTGLKAGLRREPFTDSNAAMTATSLILPRQLKYGRAAQGAVGSNNVNEPGGGWGGEKDGTAHKLWLPAVVWPVVKLILVFVVNHWLTCSVRVFFAFVLPVFRKVFSPPF